MTEYAMDRRQEPRFALNGQVLVQLGDGEISGRLGDLSLNGALILDLPPDRLHDGERVHMQFLFDEGPSFLADVRVVHAQGDRAGVEFADMPPGDFEVLAQRVMQLRRQGILPGTAWR